MQVKRWCNIGVMLVAELGQISAQSWPFTRKSSACMVAVIGSLQCKTVFYSEAHHQRRQRRVVWFQDRSIGYIIQRKTEAVLFTNGSRQKESMENVVRIEQPWQASGSSRLPSRGREWNIRIHLPGFLGALPAPRWKITLFSWLQLQSGFIL